MMFVVHLPDDQTAIVEQNAGTAGQTASDWLSDRICFSLDKSVPLLIDFERPQAGRHLKTSVDYMRREARRLNRLADETEKFAR